MNVTAALHNAVHKFPGGTNALAELMNISPTSLLHKVSPRYPGAHCSPEELVQICDFTGDMGPLHALAAKLCHQVTPLEALPGHACVEELAAAMKEASDVFVRASAALADGVVTENELHRLQREVLEAMGAMGQLMAKLTELHQAGKPSTAA